MKPVYYQIQCVNCDYKAHSNNYDEMIAAKKVHEQLPPRIEKKPDGLVKWYHLVRFD